MSIAGEAIVQGRRAAEALHARLRGLEEGVAPDAGLPGIDAGKVRFASKPGSTATPTPMLPVHQRVRFGMTEVAGTISEEQFLAEIQRCYSCGSCFGCEQCSMFCTPGCFTKLEEVGPGVYFTLSLDQCEECGKCVEVCPCGFLEVTRPNEARA